MYSAASITFLGISLTVFLRDVVEQKIPGRNAAVGTTRKVASAASLRSLRRYFGGLDGAGRRGARRTQVQRNPGYGDVAVDEGLAGHAVAGGEVGLREVLALLFLDGVGVLETAFDLALAGAAQAGAALERDPALFADRKAQQVACL